MEAEEQRLSRVTVSVPGGANDAGASGVKAIDFLARPEGSFARLAEMGVPSELAASLQEALAVRVKYRGYIEREQRTAASAAALERIVLPEALWDEPLVGLSSESREKLKRWRPVSLAQASRIAGVSPADVAVLLVHAKRSLAAV
jgi:tRNA uridine 5-carboxymethylaminomethyl modification enzyme